MKSRIHSVLHANLILLYKGDLFSRGTAGLGSRLNRLMITIGSQATRDGLSPMILQMIRGYGVGAVDYLFKPLDADVLRSKVAVFIELAKKSALIRKQTAIIIEREAEARQLAEARAQLPVDLEQRNREMGAVNKELEAFSYSVSHDLRAPPAKYRWLQPGAARGLRRRTRRNRTRISAICRQVGATHG